MTSYPLRVRPRGQWDAMKLEDARRLDAILKGMGDTCKALLDERQSGFNARHMRIMLADLDTSRRRALALVMVEIEKDR